MTFFDFTLITMCGFYMIYDVFDNLLKNRTAGGVRLNKPIFISKYVSAIHALILACIATLYLFGQIKDEMWILLQVIPVGYCIYDTLLMFGKSELYIRMSKLMVLHHILFICVAVYVAPYYPREIAIAYLAEWSNVFLHTVYIMVVTSYHERAEKIYDLLRWTTFVSFFVLRVCNFSYLTLLALSHGFWYTPFFVIGAIFTGMNIYWFVKIIKFARNIENPKCKN